MEFKKLAPEETKRLSEALRRNVEEEAPLRMNPLDTSFVLSDQQLEEDLVNAVKSVPCHY